MTARSICDMCVAPHTNACIGNATCVCNAGYIGMTCADPVTTAASVSQMNTSAIVAGVLGGVLVTLIIGLVIFFMWKKRVKKKALIYSPSSASTTTTTLPSTSIPVVVPALYDLSLSARHSTATSSPTLSYHLYDELP